MIFRGILKINLRTSDFVVQDRRFIIVQEFGCQAAIYPSIPALFLTWLIPIILCTITLFYAGLSFYNYHRRCSFFNQHLNPRSKMTTAMFFRFVGFCLFVILLAAFVTIFDMASRVGESGLLEYTSWSAVHQDDLISVISKENKSRSAAGTRGRTEVIWWMAPITAFVLVAIFASTKECWTAGLHFCISARKRTMGLFTPKQKFDLPIQYVRLFLFRSFLFYSSSLGWHGTDPVTFFRNRQLEGVTVVPLTTPPKAVHDPFKSGWDDTIKSAESLKKQTSFKPKMKVSPLRIPPPALRLPSPTHSESSAEEEHDASFAASTQNYLLSPTAKEALGRVGMIILSPMTPQSAEELDVHAESQQLIRKSPVSKVEPLKVDKHLRPPSNAFPTTPTTTSTFTAFIHPPRPTRPAPQDSLSTDIRPQPPAEPPVERGLRPSKSRENLSVSVWPRPPTSIPLSGPSPSPTRSPSRCGLTPSPTLCPSTPTTKGSGHDSYYDYVRQPSPTFPKATITNRDRAYIFGTPTTTVTATPPPRVLPPFQGPGIVQIDSVPELKAAPRSKSPVLVPGKSSLKRWGSRSSQVPCTSVTGGNASANGDGSGDDGSPSMSSFVDSPSIYSTNSGSQHHGTAAVYMSVVKETV